MLTKNGHMSFGWKCLRRTNSKRGWELTINSWFSNSRIQTTIFDRFKNRSPDFKLLMKLASNCLIDWPNFVRFNAIRASPMSFSTARVCQNPSSCDQRLAQRRTFVDDKLPCLRHLRGLLLL